MYVCMYVCIYIYITITIIIGLHAAWEIEPAEDDDGEDGPLFICIYIYIYTHRDVYTII